jgi:hypothetical protein
MLVMNRVGGRTGNRIVGKYEVEGFAWIRTVAFWDLLCSYINMLTRNMQTVSDTNPVWKLQYGEEIRVLRIDLQMFTHPFRRLDTNYAVEHSHTPGGQPASMHAEKYIGYLGSLAVPGQPL